MRPFLLTLKAHHETLTQGGSHRQPMPNSSFIQTSFYNNSSQDSGRAFHFQDGILHGEVILSPELPTEADFGQTINQSYLL